MSRIFSIEILRAVAIVCVVFIHVNSLGYKVQLPELSLNLSLFFRELANFAVPLFLFISGYFMAKKEINSFSDYSAYLKKQLPRVLIPFLTWSIFYSCISLSRGTEIKAIVIKFITFQASAPFYFLLLISQYYIIIPLLMKLGKTKNGVYLSLLMSAACCIILEVVRYRFGYNPPLFAYAGFFLTWLIFPVLGIYFERHSPKYKPKVIAAVTLLFLTISVFHSIYLINNFGSPQLAVTAIKLSSFLYSISIILFLFSIQHRFNFDNLLVNIGSLSFGVYFSHMFVLLIVNEIQAKILSVEVQYNILTQLATTALIIFICTAIGLFLRKLNKTLSTKWLGY